MSFDLNTDSNLEEPFAYLRHLENDPTEERHMGSANQNALLHKKLWSVSVSGGSQIMMMMFMMYMIGNDLTIFTMLFLFNFLSTPIKGIAAMNTVFAPYENKGVSLIQYKLIYLGIQGILTCIAGYKLSKMGLLPTSASDWLDIIPPQKQKILVIDSSSY